MDVELCQFIKAVGNYASECYNYVRNVQIGKTKVSFVHYYVRCSGVHVLNYVLLISYLPSNVDVYLSKRTTNMLLIKM